MIPLKSTLTSGAGAVLCSTPLFRDLDEELQQQLLDIGKRHDFARREMLFMDGFPVDKIFCVLGGKVRQYYCTGSGDECLRGISGFGELVSLHKIFDGSTSWSYCCEAITAVEVVAWKADEFRRLTMENAELNGRIIAMLSATLESVCRHHCLCRKPLAMSRIAGYLLKMGREAMDEENADSLRPQRIPSLKPYSFAASELCLTRETFSRALSNLEKSEVIRVEKGFVEILDESALKELSGIVD